MKDGAAADIGDKSRRSEPIGAESPSTCQDGAGFGCAGLCQPDAAGHLGHEGSRARFSDGDDLSN